MSMNEPLEPFSGRSQQQGQGMPAADGGTGAHSPAQGFGIGGEEPDVGEEGGQSPDVSPADDSPFRTPDPGDVGREQR